MATLVTIQNASSLVADVIADSHNLRWSIELQYELAQASMSYAKNLEHILTKHKVPFPLARGIEHDEIIGFVQNLEHTNRQMSEFLKAAADQTQKQQKHLHNELKSVYKGFDKLAAETKAAKQALQQLDDNLTKLKLQPLKDNGQKTAKIAEEKQQKLFTYETVKQKLVDKIGETLPRAQILSELRNELNQTVVGDFRQAAGLMIGSVIGPHGPPLFGGEYQLEDALPTLYCE